MVTIFDRMNRTA